MNFSINQSELHSVLNVVSKGAATRSTLPILSGILIRASQGSIELEATDMDQSIKCVCPALVESEGQVVIPARLLTDVIKNLGDAAIHVQTSEDTATVLCDNSSFSLKTLNADDFPGFPVVEEETSVHIPFKIFSDGIKKVARVVSRDDSRPILSGVFIQVEEGILRLVATDSYRLALEELPIEDNNSSFSAVISGNFLNDLASLPAENETIELALSENQIIARYGNYTFINRRIEGNYPNYNQLLPENISTKVVFNTKQLLDAAKRVSLVSNNTSPVRFNINNGSQTTQLSSTSQDIGAAQETVSSSVEGEDVEIAFNAHYLIDGLTSFTDNEIVLELQGGVKPGIFKTQNNNFIYLIMPVRLS